MAKYIVVNIIDDLNKINVTRVDKIDVSTITNISFSKENLLKITAGTVYYISNSLNDLSLQLLQLTLSKADSEPSALTVKSPNGTFYQIVVSNTGNLSCDPII